ncbi:hypothetical protein GCM10010277_12760 [Streptomyces longisporoflavus]|uniref:hypothetical protein n=1 Tax=Streptomyces longisporoflavus TaxID=28044 RepID=UPI00167E3BB6|nr:hypothetical protein [Streptomyces longisporoflavus]GGV29757.1 hypothetical protein GCM10010277_12760 [Streptomyces longisporoflavus]
MVTARTLPRDPLLLADRRVLMPMPTATVAVAVAADCGLVTPPPDESLTIGVRGRSTHE